MPVYIPNLLEGKLLTGVLPPEKQPPIQYFLPQYSQPILMDIEACIDDPSLAPLGSHVKKQKKVNKKKLKEGQVYIEPKKTNKISSTHGSLMLRRRNLEATQLGMELEQLTPQTSRYLKPSHLSSFNNLVELDISRNNLSSLPHSITHLTQLKILNLSSNQFTEIPKELYALKELNVLILSQNKIQTIPEEMPFQLPRLITFRIAANNIRSLPSQLSIWNMMQHLQLGSVYGGNRLRSLPDSIIEMPVLQELDLSYNQLRSLPHDFEIQSLQILNLSHNQIDCLPNNITRCYRLKSLNLSKNHLTSLPADLVHLRQLELLDISENLLCIMPAEILERMESALLITGNPLTRPGECDLRQSSHDAYSKILRHMMKRGVARSSPIGSPSLSNANPMEQCGPNGMGCLIPSSPIPSTEPESSSGENPFHLRQPYQDIDASIDQELSYHAQQLNIDGSRPVIQEGLTGTTRLDEIETPDPSVSLDLSTPSPLPTQTQLVHSLREIATRTLLTLNIKIPLNELPCHLADEIDHHKRRLCAFCKGPFINEWVTSVQVKSFAGHPAVVRRVRYCSTKCFSSCLPKDHSKSVVCVHHN